MACFDFGFFFGDGGSSSLSDGRLSLLERVGFLADFLTAISSSLSSAALLFRDEPCAALDRFRFAGGLGAIVDVDLRVDLEADAFEPRFDAPDVAINTYQVQHPLSYVQVLTLPPLFLLPLHDQVVRTIMLRHPTLVPRLVGLRIDTLPFDFILFGPLASDLYDLPQGFIVIVLGHKPLRFRDINVGVVVGHGSRTKSVYVVRIKCVVLIPRYPEVCKH